PAPGVRPCPPCPGPAPARARAGGYASPPPAPGPGRPPPRSPASRPSRPANQPGPSLRPGKDTTGPWNPARPARQPGRQADREPGNRPRRHRQPIQPRSRKIQANDLWLEGCPHNTASLVNVFPFLSSETTTEQRRAQAVVKSQAFLFLSHATPNKEIVSQVFRLLTGEYAVGSWIDAQELLPGDSLPEHIQQGIARATAFVVFWSAAAAQSRWVKRELDIALSVPTPTLLLVCLDGSEVPERLKDLLRVEAARMAPAEIARRLAEPIR